MLAQGSLGIMGIYELMAETAEMVQRALVEQAAAQLAERSVEVTPH